MSIFYIPDPAQYLNLSATLQTIYKPHIYWGKSCG